jgi:hypothetical protein
MIFASPGFSLVRFIPTRHKGKRSRGSSPQVDRGTARVDHVAQGRFTSITMNNDDDDDDDAPEPCCLGSSTPQMRAQPLIRGADH